MNRIILSSIFLLLFINVALSQEEDRIYLKNGSIIKGNISESDSTTKIITKDGSLWVFKNTDVTKVEKKISNSDSRAKYSKSLRVDVGFLLAEIDENNSRIPISFLAVYSLPIGGGIYFGFGTGLEYFKNTYISLVGNFRYQPKNVAFVLQGGYSTPLKKEGILNEMKYDYEPTFFFSPEIAYVVPSINGASFTISAGLRSERITAKQKDNYLNNDYKIIEKYNRLVLRFGYTFR